MANTNIDDINRTLGKGRDDQSDTSATARESQHARTLPVHEMFSTFQGEGCYMGRAAFFIRLYGCPIKCPWCDSAGTWHPNFKPEKGVARMTTQELLAAAKESQAPIVVITGGEPAIHDLTELTVALGLAGLRVHIETSGAFELKGSFDWITVSPKINHLPAQSVLLVADEIKLIVEHEDSISFWRERLSRILDCDFHNFAMSSAMLGNVWLHPEWSQRAHPLVIGSIVEHVKTFPRVYRAGYQLHKLFKADTFDLRSAAPVPLGGDPSKGF
jgi:organic radical activating enzyme